MREDSYLICRQSHSIWLNPGLNSFYYYYYLGSVVRLYPGHDFFFFPFFMTDLCTRVPYVASLHFYLAATHDGLCKGHEAHVQCAQKQPQPLLLP